ncbi:MAG TPA: hypothetical protein VHL09_03180 [Dehalococcoidia bacterium]|nr:hypothetical protein [Dehalococcoidia bacterium]
MTFTQMSPDKFGEAVILYRESTMPAAQASPGNRGLMLLIDRATGKSIAVSLWDTETDLMGSESDSGYYHEQLAKFRPFYTVPPVRQDYEVVLSE